MIGSYLGGRLTGSLGAYKVQHISLFGAGFCFFILMYLQAFRLLAGISYAFLFAADGTTCIFAGIVFYLYFRNRKPNVLSTHKTEKSKTEPSVSPL
ncbi:MAG: hypothetical protein ACK4IY_08545 [Chitinophagales bacterium]